MKILEDEELRQLIQKIIDEDKKEEPMVTMSNLVSAKPIGPVKYYDPTEDRVAEPQGFNFKVPPPKYDDKGFSIRSGSRNRNLSYLQPNEDDDEEDVLKA